MWERERILKNSKSKNFKEISHKSSQSLQLPKLLRKTAEIVAEKYALNKEQLFKTFNKEIYLDGTLRKILENYAKFSAKEQEDDLSELLKSQDDGFEDLQREILSFGAIKAAKSATIIEKTAFFLQNRVNLEKKIERKARNCEAFVCNKQANIQLFRRENSYISGKLSQIKHLVRKNRENRKIA